MKTLNTLFTKGCMVLASAALLTTGCTDDFLKQDPLSFYNPENTYTTESGLQAAMAMCDYGLKEMLMDGNGNVLPMASLYFMTDLGLYAKTDAGDMQDDFANKITPTSGMKGGGDENAMSRFWDRTWNSVTFANTIISNVDKVEGLDPTLRDEYLGRAYFHRAYAYYHGVLLFGDIPLITKLIEVPKQNYKSTSKEAIFQMLVHDLEFAVEHVPPQKEIGYIGTVNQEACMQLLIKCYLVVGEYAKAEELPSKIYDRSALPIVRLFGVENKAQEDDEEDTEIFMERLEDECKNMLSAVMSKLDIISQMIMVGYSPDNKNDLRRGALVVRWEKSSGGVISLFGMDSTTDEGRKLKKSADKMGYHWYEKALTAMLERQNIESSSVDDFRMIPENNLFYKGGRPASISSSQLLRYRNIGELLTEEKIYSIRPLGRIQQSRWFLNFLTRSSVDGPQWYGYLRQSEFYLKRNFEEILVDLVLNILSGKAMSVPGYSTPVVLHGDPGSGKSVILGALAYRVFMKKVNPVIFIHKKELNLGTDLEELDQMMQDIENAGEADTRILLIWDGAAYRNVEKNAKNFARQLDNRGRRFVLVCSAYRNVAFGNSGRSAYRGVYSYASEGLSVKSNHS